VQFHSMIGYPIKGGSLMTNRESVSYMLLASKELGLDKKSVKWSRYKNFVEGEM
jgi:hypothetical protein